MVDSNYTSNKDRSIWFNTTNYNSIDINPDEAFDNLARLATFICKAPIALITILDDTRHWFKSKIGLTDLEAAQALSFSKLTTEQSDILIIQNTLKDQQLNQNCLVINGPQVQFYAGIPLVMPDGYIIGTLGIFDRTPRDLSFEQKEALRTLAFQASILIELKIKETEIRLSEKRYRDLVETSNDLIWSVDTEGRFIFINKAVKRTHGYEPEEILGLPFSTLLPSGQIAKDQRTFEKIKAGEPVFEYETVHRRKDGSLAYLLFNAIPLKDADGKVIGTTGTARDITEYRLAEEALKESEARFRYIAESNMLGILFWDVEGNIKEANDAFLQMTGYTREDIFNGHVRWIDMTPPEYYPLEEKALAEIATKGVCTPFEKEYIRKDGSRLPILIGGAVNEWPHGIGVSFVLDMSEHKKAQRALQKERDFISAIVDTIGGLVTVVDSKGHIIRFNRAFERLTGYNIDEVKNRPFWDILLLPDEIEPVKNLFNQICEGDFPKNFENHLVTKDGSTILIDWDYTALLDQSGRVEFVIGTGIDITERKKAEQALRDSEERLRLALETAGMGTYEWDIKTNHVRRSESLKGLHHLPLDNIEPTLESFMQFVHPEDRHLLQSTIEQTIRDNSIHSLDYRLLLPDGTIRWISEKGRLHTDRNGMPTRLVSVVMDITERKRAEAIQQRINVELEERVEQRTIELTLINRALRQSETRFRQLAENINEVFWVRDIKQNSMLYISPAYEQIWGRSCESLYDHQENWLDAIFPEDIERVKAASEEVNNGRANNIEYRIIRSDGTVRWVDARSFPIRDEAGNIYRVGGIVEDITERKEAEERLKESEERFRTQYKNIPIPTYSWKRVGDDFILVDFNTAGEAVTKGSIVNWLGKTASEMHRERPKIIELLSRCFSEKRTLKQELSHTSKQTGEVTHYNVTYVFVPPDLVMVHSEDITEQRRAVEALRNFADSLTTVQEEERRRISRQLHDDVGQTLVAIAVRLSIIERELRNIDNIDQSVYEELGHLQNRLQAVQQNLRSLAHALHPSVLEHFGLTRALSSYLETICLKSGLKFSIEEDPNFPRFNQTIETSIYRIMQEAILNTLKHAQAKNVVLRFIKKDNIALVKLEDDGCGFDISKLYALTGIGVVSMRERADIIGAKLEMKSLKGEGTLVTLNIPINSNLKAT
jgi:PAS domain S-box-containing protein